MMELFWTPEATQDRDEIYDNIEAANTAAALALDELFSEKAGRLVDHPGLGRSGRTREFECCVCCVCCARGQTVAASSIINIKTGPF